MFETEKERLTPGQLGKRWDKSPRTLANWRTQRIGPTYFKIGRDVYYYLSDVQEYENSQRQIISPRYID